MVSNQAQHYLDLDHADKSPSFPLNADLLSQDPYASAALPAWRPDFSNSSGQTTLGPFLSAVHAAYQ